MLFLLPVVASNSIVLSVNFQSASSVLLEFYSCYSVGAAVGAVAFVHPFCSEFYLRDSVAAAVVDVPCPHWSRFEIEWRHILDSFLVDVPSADWFRCKFYWRYFGDASVKVDFVPGQSHQPVAAPELFEVLASDALIVWGFHYLMALKYINY